MKRWHVLVAVCALGLVLGAGITWAAIPDSNGVIHTCYKNNAWRVIDSALETCRTTETALDFNPGAVRPVVRATTWTITPGEIATRPSFCHAGEVATGGSWRVVGPTGSNPDVTSSGDAPTTTITPEPLDGQTPTGWKVVGASNHDVVDHEITVYAICAPAG